MTRPLPPGRRNSGKYGFLLIRLFETEIRKIKRLASRNSRHPAVQASLLVKEKLREASEE